MRQREGNYTIERWTRLPVFLQQAGQFKAALKEFERLIQEVDDRVKRESQLDASPTWIEYQTNLDLMHIYDKMRMTYKREKRPDEANKYAELSLKHSQQAETLRDVLEDERKNERLVYETKRAARQSGRLD